MKKENKKNYLAPVVMTKTVVVEQGFQLSDLSSVENLTNSNEEFSF